MTATLLALPFAAMLSTTAPANARVLFDVRIPAALAANPAQAQAVGAVLMFHVPGEGKWVVNATGATPTCRRVADVPALRTWTGITLIQLIDWLLNATEGTWLNVVIRATIEMLGQLISGGTVSPAVVIRATIEALTPIIQAGGMTPGAVGVTAIGDTGAFDRFSPILNASLR